MGSMGGPGFQCGDDFCLDQSIWCNKQDEEELHSLNSICPEVIASLNAVWLCGNYTFWQNRTCFDDEKM